MVGQRVWRERLTGFRSQSTLKGVAADMTEDEV